MLLAVQFPYVNVLVKNKNEHNDALSSSVSLREGSQSQNRAITGGSVCIQCQGGEQGNAGIEGVAIIVCRVHEVNMTMTTMMIIAICFQYMNAIWTTTT